MIYRLLLDQALTVRSTPVLSFARLWRRTAKKKWGIKKSVARLLTDKSSFVY